jgi:hypothetical protein
MDYAILVLIAVVLGGGVAGALVVVLGWEKRTYGLRTRMDAVEADTALLNGRVLAEIKRRSGEAGLAQRSRNKEIEDLARSLPTEKKVQELSPAWWEMNESAKHG